LEEIKEVNNETGKKYNNTKKGDIDDRVKIARSGRGTCQSERVCEEFEGLFIEQMTFLMSFKMKLRSSI
jgi:hypothetical protein